MVKSCVYRPEKQANTTSYYAIECADYDNKQEQNKREEVFLKDLARVFNVHCVDSTTNTPDFILARLTYDFLNGYMEAVETRDKWFSFEPFKDRLVIKKD